MAASSPWLWPGWAGSSVCPLGWSCSLPRLLRQESWTLSSTWPHVGRCWAPGFWARGGGIGSLQWPPPSSSKSYSANVSWPNAEAVNSGTRCRQLGRSSFHFVFNWKSPLAVGSHAGGPCLPNSPPCWTTVLGACHFSCWTTTSPGYARCSGRCVVPPMQWHSGPLFLTCWNLFGRWRTHLAAPCRARCHLQVGWKGRLAPRTGKAWASSASAARRHWPWAPAASRCVCSQPCRHSDRTRHRCHSSSAVWKLTWG